MNTLFKKIDCKPIESLSSLGNTIQVADSLYNQLLKNYSNINVLPNDSDALLKVLEGFNEWLSNPIENGVIRIHHFAEAIKKLANLAKDIIHSAIEDLGMAELCDNVLDVLEELNDIGSTSKNCLRIILLCGEFLHFIKDIFDFGLNDNVGDLRQYAIKGASHIKVSWNDYRNYVDSFFKNYSTLSVKELIKKILEYCFLYEKRIPSTAFSPKEKDCIAVASYAYCDSNYHNEGKTQKLFIEPIKKCTTLGYDSSKMQFEISGGLRGAILRLSNDREESVILAFSGTKKWCVQNFLTDVVQILSFADSVYFAALGVAIELNEVNPDTSMIITGHSLGGGLAQFAVSSMQKSNVKGICYNSAGLSSGTCGIIQKAHANNCEPKVADQNLITHIVMNQDPISKIGILLGTVKKLKSDSNLDLRAHKCITINEALNKEGAKYCTTLCNNKD